MKHLAYTDIEAQMEDVLASPKDVGVLEAIVIRPEEDKRQFAKEVELSVERGVEGDRWYTSCHAKLENGDSDPGFQVSIMNARILNVLAQHVERSCLAGDNLIVDFDLSEDNVRPGDHLQIGQVVLEITDIPHAGCNKFAARYGADAVKFINANERWQLHLRGLYAKVIHEGTVRIGDTITKMANTDD